MSFDDFGRVHTPCDDCLDGHCTMNCSPRDSANDKLTVTTTFQVAAYWPGEGYGGGTPCETMKQAEAEALEYERRGYGGGDNRIHIIRTIRSVTEWEISPASAAKLAEQKAKRDAKRKKPRQAVSAQPLQPGEEA